MNEFSTEELPTRPDSPSVLPPPTLSVLPEPAPQFAPLVAMRIAASLLLTYAVKDSVCPQQEPRYKLIVEGRLWPKYSSCGDLAHWLYFRLGIRAPWINRAEFTKDQGGHGWRVGMNLNLLVAPPVGQCDIANGCHKLTSILDVQPGDLLQISNVYGGHEICVSGVLAQPDGSLQLTTAEYGQPGGAKKEHVLRFSKEAGLCFLTGAHGSNQVTSHISLAKALELPGRVAPDLRLLDAAQLEVFKAAH